MVGAMSSLHGGGGGRGKKKEEGSCTSVSLGKYVRRALRAASGRPKRIKEKERPRRAAAAAAEGASVELVSGSSAARRESVVRVVMWSGVVEVYPGVVLACSVIRKHPPGLCLAHPDVFRNPHAARVRPLQPLFPGQKFLLLPETTVQKLQRHIPEGSVGAFHDGGDDGDGTSEEDVTTSSSDHSGSGGGGGASSEEEREAAVAAPASVCSARELWAEEQFSRMVERGLAVEQRADVFEPAERKGKGTRKKKSKKRKGKKRRDPSAPALMGCRTSLSSRLAATARRAWEPSLPAVEEKEEEEPPPSESSEGTAQLQCSVRSNSNGPD